MNDRAGINYGRIMERAMRTVMAEVLGQVAEDGLPGDHHFYITFDTSHAGVDMPAHLKAAHPGDMMIVMKHWFDDLAVMGDRFQVTLNFSNVPETLVIPF
ncbi:MAG: ClpXP protease specificity-enhancing factor SspB, partial [Pseudomonadota bacterium]